MQALWLTFIARPSTLPTTSRYTLTGIFEGGTHHTFKMSQLPPQVHIEPPRNHVVFPANNDLAIRSSLLELQDHLKNKRPSTVWQAVPDTNAAKATENMANIENLFHLYANWQYQPTQVKMMQSSRTGISKKQHRHEQSWFILRAVFRHT